MTTFIVQRNISFRIEVEAFNGEEAVERVSKLPNTFWSMDPVITFVAREVKR